MVANRRPRAPSPVDEALPSGAGRNPPAAPLSEARTGAKCTVGGRHWGSPSLRGALAALAALGAIGATSSTALAQQRTFYLDRLTVAGGPEDGIGVWRPVAGPKSRVFAQMGLGFTLNPLRMRTIASDTTRLTSTSGAPVSTQLIDYLSAGVDIADRAQLLVTLPIAFYESGADATAVVQGLGSFSSGAVHDLRLDVRSILYRSDDQKWSFGAGLSLYLPTGNVFAYGGDNAAHTALYLAVETTSIRDMILTFNTGIHTRPYGRVGGLAVGDEWTFAFGAFHPMREGRIRLGAEIFGSTGLEELSNGSSSSYGTFFAGKNTPLELLLEGRMTIDKTNNQLWVGGGVGTHLDLGYGAPDLRVIAMAGYWLPIENSSARSPDRKLRARDRFAGAGKDTDHDGIPDDIDLCPDVPEDHLEPDPADGCPKAPDRDGDGVPDAYDKCPDVPEDKDGLADDDGCPEDDYDVDGVPDVKDACPREPGQPSPEPKKNGCPQFIKRIEGSTEIEILKKIEFDTGKASIKQSSYGILDEIGKLLKANVDIKRVNVEGHTDDRGSLQLNNRLSQERADSVVRYLVDHGIASGRLDAHGYGPSKPIESNETPDGRQKNRRVEFHITQQEAAVIPQAHPARRKETNPTRQGGDWDRLAPGSEDDHHSTDAPADPGKPNGADAGAGGN